MRYEKGRKDATRRRIMDVAAERFRSEGVAATGLAAIMSEAGLTNGAFYPHFRSKAELVRESLAAAMDEQTQNLRAIAAEGGLEAAIASYLSPEHRDNPQAGCTLSALLPELARQPAEARRVFTERLLGFVESIASALPAEVKDRESTAMALHAMLIGSLQLARAVDDSELSDRILAAGAVAARELASGGLN
jgi:TetR/AcrR family transcriptional regulator, transcriptional repressor for nem operon